MPIELDAQTQADLAELAVELANKPETRKDFAHLVKKVQPNRRFHDVEVDDIRAEIRKEFEERDQRAAQSLIVKAMEREKAKLADRYDEKAIGEIESLMEKHGLSDYGLAARLYAAETKPANPTPQPDDHRWTLPNIDLKDFNNLKQIGRASAYKAVDEIVAKRNSTHH